MILTDFSFTLGAEDVLRGEGVDPGIAQLKRPPLVEAAEAALREGLPILHPVAAIQEVTVHEFRHEHIALEGGMTFTGSLVTHHLAGAQHVEVVVCTIGAELEKLSASQLNANPLLGLALDGLGNAAVEAVAQMACNYIEEKAQAKGLQASTPLSPGAPDWPVETGQSQIFALLDPSEAGVTLTSGGMMVPKKSISFVAGIGTRMIQDNLCAVCSLKETCRYHHD